MTIAWHSFDLVSGRRGPQLEAAALGQLKRILGEVTETVIDVVVHDVETGQPVLGWEAATEPGVTMLVAIDTTADDEAILWGGQVLTQARTGAATVSVTVKTLEHYYLRRFTGDQEWADVDVATMATDVASAATPDGIGIIISANPTGTILSGRYGDDEDKTIASVLEELEALEGGIEWTIDLAWGDPDHTFITKTLHIARRLGRSPDYPTQWTMPGVLVDFELIRSYDENLGANDVLAVSSGEGQNRPTARAVDQALIDSESWPRYEKRWTPATSLTNEQTIEAHAAAELARTRLGLEQLSVKARIDMAPRVGIDWWLGDDIGIAITAPALPEQIDPDGNRVPGLTRVVRVVGYDLDLAQRLITPITQEG